MMINALTQHIEPGTGWIAAFFVQFAFLIGWWIKGMADRKRASTEDGVALVKSMRGEIDRLTARVDKLEIDKEADNKLIAQMAAEILAKSTEIALEKIKHGAEMAEQKALVKAAEVEANVLRTKITDNAGSLVEATLAVAHQTERVGDAAEAAVKKGTV